MATVRVVYTDPIGNELTETFTVRSTFFPFGKEYITTNLFSEGIYDEATHTFKTGQYGQMGWVYSNGADMYLTNNDDYSPSAIRSITTDESRTTNGVYDLQGRRLKESEARNPELKKGLYIVNGRKVAKVH